MTPFSSTPILGTTHSYSHLPTLLHSAELQRHCSLNAMFVRLFGVGECGAAVLHMSVHAVETRAHTPAPFCLLSLPLCLCVCRVCVVRVHACFYG